MSMRHAREGNESAQCVRERAFVSARDEKPDFRHLMLLAEAEVLSLEELIHASVVKFLRKIRESRDLFLGHIYSSLGGSLLPRSYGGQVI